MRNCISSCYDCIRDYSNKQYHIILDWRLGLDLSRMAADKAFFVNFDVEYWKGFMDYLMILVWLKWVSDVKNTLLPSNL